MPEFPLFIPIKILGQGLGNIMFVTNPDNSKKYIVAMSVQPTNKTLGAAGFDNIKEIKSRNDLYKLFNSITSDRKDDIEGVAIYSGEYQQYVSLR